MKPTIWINLDPQKVDLTCLEQRFAGKYHFIEKAIPGNDPKAVLEQAKQADVVFQLKRGQLQLYKAGGKMGK